MRVAIIGCGMIGRKRAVELCGATVAVCCDLNLERARLLAEKYDARATQDWQEAATCDDVRCRPSRYDSRYVAARGRTSRCRRQACSHGEAWRPSLG